MLFILTNSDDATASFLVTVLKSKDVPFIRFDTDVILQKVAFEYRGGIPILTLEGVSYQPEQIRHIWYRRPEGLKHEKFDSSPESKYTQAEWTEFIENFFAHIPTQRWVNHPSNNAAASRKLEQLTTASRIGLKIPQTLATQDPHTLRAFYREHKGRVIAKPLSTGYIERLGSEPDSLIYTNEVQESDLRATDTITACPTLFQEFINKESDVRISVVGDEIHAVTLSAKEKYGEQRCDIRRNNMSDVTYASVELPDSVRRMLFAIMSHYNLRFAAIDMAISKTGEWYFFEINPNGQWAWLDQVAGTNIAGSFVKLFHEGK